MNGMRKFVCFLIGVMLAAISLPSIAGGNSQTKYFSATFPVLVAGGTSTIPVKFYNATPKGVSTINSITITTPNTSVIINTTASSPGTWIFLGTANGGNIYEANNFTGIQNGQTGTFNVSITDTDPNAQCVSGTWGASANAGNAPPSAGGPCWWHTPRTAPRLTRVTMRSSLWGMSAVREGRVHPARAAEENEAT